VAVNLIAQHLGLEGRQGSGIGAVARDLHFFGHAFNLAGATEAQHVVGAVAQHFEQQPGLALSGTAAVGGGVGQADEHALAEPVDQRSPPSTSPTPSNTS